MDEFIRWCDDKGYPLATRYQVDGDKLHFFLEESVIGRKHRPTNPKRRIIDDDSTTVEEEVEAYVIGFSSIEQYVSAVVLLFHDQCRLNLNVPTNHPRIPDVKTLLKNERKKETRRRKENYADRVAGSILDGYSTTDELAKVVDYFLTKDRPEHYRNAVMFLASHFGLMHGGNVREIELADVHYIPLQGEGPNPEVECPCLILLMDHGKTNQFGKQEHASAIRCGYVEICLWMTPGIYFFRRWHISAFKKAFDDCHIKSTSFTHAGRKSGAKMADLGDTGASDIRWAGRWMNDSMEGSYLTNLPRRMLRVEEWQTKIDQGQGDQNVAADGFLKMLQILKVTFLQDSVMIIKRHPHLSIWSAPLFNDLEYLAYKSDLEQSIAITPPPEDLLLSRAMPHLHNYIRQTHADVMQQVNHNNQLLQQHVNVFNQAMGDLANGRLTISVQWAPNSSAAPNDSSVSATPSSSSMPSPSPINIPTLTPSVNLTQHPHQPVTTPSTITTTPS
ncbi:hypothetical protein INT45_012853 [Circinella minor]|uniref:Ndc10 domain-containing protein n=1 Tax=Circinella minor TaxID=1195481 RepID=A0A8H7VKU1_9FUNG|nr:hypothetical protein INT45_012853 [Circinella minor]